MGKIDFKKMELKKSASYVAISSLKEAITIIVLGLILTPITLWLMECFVQHFFGYTLY